SAALRDLLSFPTRRSSDLEAAELMRLDRIPRQRGLGADAGKGRIVDEGEEALGEALLGRPGCRRAGWGAHRQRTLSTRHGRPRVIGAASRITVRGRWDA